MSKFSHLRILSEQIKCMKMHNNQYKYPCICITDDALVVIGLCQSTKSVKPLI